eukprot:CAMPEP_0202695114 /NCGR_PEP_ID=MMETSP1385-20130828/8785_1 /ASSEMBLY_ACC=CAM_ASM_000861 /TAXON_ID=933848 /ORGANISM="Elphidium margaritaceum" /LENGTH=762 /DNA_ID=CAMNT_0049351077 /DNA_START=56 /DNA_END=2344 /DNA_ORIENTATION=-
MSIYVSLRQLLLSQIGYLLFTELHVNKSNKQETERRLSVLQTAFEQLKSAQYHNHYHSVIDHFEFEIDEQDLQELNNIQGHAHDTKYIHPFGFGIWLQEQSFIDLGMTGTMDDSETTKQMWADLTGKTFIKLWKKRKISLKHIIQTVEHRHARNRSEVDDANDDDTNDAPPCLDISIDGNSAVNAEQFCVSVCENRTILLQLSSKCASNNKQQPPPATDAAMGISGINLFETIENQNTFRVLCCLLWEPRLALDVLREFLRCPSFNINGKHKLELQQPLPDRSSFELNGHDASQASLHANGVVDSMADALTPYGLGAMQPTDAAGQSGTNLQLPLVGGQLYAQLRELSVASSPAPPSICSGGHLSQATTAYTAYTGYGYHNAERDMDEDEIYKYLMEMDYEDKKNPVRYEWKLMVDALNAFQFKVVSIDDYTDDDVLHMVQRVQEGVVNSIHDQRSGLIKVACNLLVLIAQYRTALFFDETFFKSWMLCLLRKCANRDRIRTLPAHDACRDIVACIVSYYVNNKDNSKAFLLRKLKEMFVIFVSLWTPNALDPSWMKQVKSVTQFITNIASMIEHTAILHQAPAHAVDKVIESVILESQQSECAAANGSGGGGVNSNLKPIENVDIREMQDIAFDLFKQFSVHSHKEARDCAVQLLINLYKLEQERTFEFAKEFFVKRELLDYLKKLKKLDILREAHLEYFDSLRCKSNSRTRIRKVKKAKTSTTTTTRATSSRADMKRQVKKLKGAKSITIPEESSTDHGQ